MPVQRSILGQPITWRTPPRRFLVVFGLVFLGIVTVILNPVSRKATVDPLVQEFKELTHGAQHILPRPDIPQLYNPFGDAVHKPMWQDNETHGSTSWYTDLQWLNPFSSSITLDDDRAVLPPLRVRPKIYTFYDTRDKKPEVAEAEHKLLLTWRRAWWAKGFKPIVLGLPEAKKHPLYSRLGSLNLEKPFNTEILRWLAWSHMGGGILANWLVFPMAEFEHPVLDGLRKRECKRLMRYATRANAVFCGTKDIVDAAIRQLLEADNVEQISDLISELPDNAFEIEKRDNGIAFYSIDTIKTRHPAIAEKLRENQAKGLNMLRETIQAHLHSTWQRGFPDGIAVLQPHPLHTSIITKPATTLAQQLLQCPPAKQPPSCPPNDPRCKPCTPSGSRVVPVRPLSTSTSFVNKTTLFTIGTVPHPYTFVSLHYARAVLDVSFIRRDTERDLWLAGVTEQLLGHKVGGPQRLIRFKDAVAGEFGVAHGIWLTPIEDDLGQGGNEISGELSWVFGFELPPAPTGIVEGSKPAAIKSRKLSLAGLGGFNSPAAFIPSGPSDFELSPNFLKPRSPRAARPLRSEVTDESPPEKPRPPPREKPHIPSEPDIMREGLLLDLARKIVKSNKEEDRLRRGIVESWNLADMEAWKFARAFAGRRRAERLNWEDEERRFAGSEERSQGWGRWISGHLT